MTTEHLRRVNTLVEACLEHGQNAQNTWLENRCGDDKQLLEEVRNLLALQDSQFMALSVPQALVQAGDMTGRRMGAYRITSLLDGGGMGDIYRAVRADDAYEQEVAVKVIKAGLNQPLLRQRFLNERQLLARLEHPNIARLLDGGTLENGQPYLVMEYVEGKPIDAFCAENQYNTPQRLELFRQVCDAVQYAHARLVVHRDLKPANILVRADGTPCLLDFGIARLLDSKEREAVTSTGMRPMSPQYASPEQIAGQEIGIASDVYSLGVLLYKLLTGTSPYDLKTNSAAVLERAILEQTPPPPSQAAPHIRDLKGDVDNMVLTALQKEPDRRYATAADFSQDLGRHLSGFPVKARRPTFYYLTGKFLARHQLAVLSVTTTLLLLLGSAFHTRSQNKKITLERDRSQQVVHFLVGLFENAAPGISRGEAITVREVLDLGRRNLSEFLTDQPVARSTLLQTMGDVYHHLGIYDQAEPLLDKALQLRLNHLGKSHLLVAETLDTLARIKMNTRDLPEAYTMFKQARDIRMDALGQHHELTALSTVGLATIYMLRGEYDHAQSLYQQVLPIYRIIYGQNHSEVAGILSYLGIIHREKGEIDPARQLFEQAIAINRRVWGDKPHHSLVENYHDLGRLLNGVGEFGQAKTLFSEALNIQEQLFGTEYVGRSMLLDGLGTALQGLGDLEEAETQLRQALRLDRQFLGDHNMNTAISMTNLSLILRDAGQLQEAISFCEQALNVQTEQLGPFHPETAAVTHNLGVMLHETGTWDRAESLLREATAVRLHNFGPQHPRTLQSQWQLTRFLGDMGRFSSARSLGDQVINHEKATRGEQDPRVLDKQAELAMMSFFTGRPDQALQKLQAINQKAAQHLETNSPVLHKVNLRLARSLMANEQWMKAENLYNQFMMDARNAGKNRDLIELICDLISLSIQRGNHLKAENLLQEARMMHVAGEEPNTHQITLIGLEGALLAQCGAFAAAESLLWESYLQLARHHGPFSWDRVEARSRLQKLYHLWDRPNPMTHEVMVDP